MGGSGGAITAGGANGDRGIQELNCPRKFETTLVDIFQAGSASYAFGLRPGTELTIERGRQGGVALTHDGRVIGYLPSQYDMIIECISSGWKYSATIIEISGIENSPRIKVMLIGAS
jgi:hypothetical protein